MIKRFFNAVFQFTLITVGLFLACDVSAQSLSVREQRLADMLIQGVLPMTDLTREQQAIFGPAVIRGTFDLADEAFAEINVLFDIVDNSSLSNSEADSIFEEIDELFGDISAIGNALAFSSERILFGRPRAPRRAFTIGELLARARARRVPALVRAVGGARNLTDPLAILNQLPLTRAVAVDIFNRSALTPEVLSSSRFVTESVAIARAMFQIGARRARTEVASALIAVVVILDSELGLL